MAQLASLDLEGVLIPEIWINFAQKTGIDELLATTRDIPGYEVLMTRGLERLQEGPHSRRDPFPSRQGQARRIPWRR